MNSNMLSVNGKKYVKRISLSIDKDLFEKFDSLIRSKAYSNRSKAIADALKYYLENYSWESKGKDAFGVISLVYDHNKSRILDKLVDLQHKFNNFIISSNHVHINEKYCLETVLIRAKDSVIIDLASKFQSLKGVEKVKLLLFFA
ncbi:MAG: nickel-responsive transcriptional regulator NikR [Candidatus Diapherotrites archaeon]|nr:nickel-responsive transcriptional regulator NikR [Candidatus Diapherotrites archaeon]